MITQEDIEEGLKVLQYEDCNPTHYMQFLYNSEPEKKYFTKMISVLVGGNVFDLYFSSSTRSVSMTDVNWFRSIVDSANISYVAYTLPVDVPA